MIDLHIHTKCSDGCNTPSEILKMAEDLKLEYISITDHDTCQAYFEIEKNRKIYSGKIIAGCEMQTTFKGLNIEVLCYGIEYEKVNNWCEKKFSIEVKKRQVLEEILRGIKVCNDLNIKYDKDVLLKSNEVRSSSNILLMEICKYEENKDKFPEDAWNNLEVFYRKYRSNEEDVWYIGERNIFPSLGELIQLVKEDGGLLFLAHPCEYKIYDMDIFLKELFFEHKLDGIECYHSTFTDEESEFLVRFCSQNNLYISGGTDYHGGEVRKGNSIGIGTGNMNIKTDTIKDWVNKVKII
ncbi:MAG TPA: hypothetical protein DEP72_00565 [Clostridiales bacterium]|nr:MAG: hypothetical protein A2Y18_03015 [Clostridiales bacterium GWD2_32_19]HCC06644.1 hypothetical protein [Clostridiales bacterium]